MIARPIYRIVDEPLPSRLGRMAVRPYFPLLATMLGGVLVAWPWFAVNAFALGSVTRRREVSLVVGGFFGTCAYVWAYAVLDKAGKVPASVVPYASILLVVWKLLISYWLYELQERAAQLRTHFGARLRSGAGVVAAAFIVRGTMIAAVAPTSVWAVAYWVLS
jgi:hypothetical protein